MRTWIKKTCKFCNKELTEEYFPTCDCVGWQAAEVQRQAEWDKAHRDDPPPEDFEKTYPLIYKNRIEFNSSSSETGDCIAVDARKYKDGVGLCIYLPFWDDKGNDWDDSGLCFDISDEALPALRQMLKEAEEAILAFKEK